jgi:hypothetical protein
MAFCETVFRNIEKVTKAHHNIMKRHWLPAQKLGMLVHGTGYPGVVGKQKGHAWRVLKVILTD